MRDILHSKYPDMEVIFIRQEDLAFEERVRLKCFQCRNYRECWTCPAHLPDLDYRRLLGEYEHAAVVVSLGTANELHRAMLFLESELMKRGNPLAQSFIGGRCELCKGGCKPEACARPEQARIPWDAIGCNVTRSLESIGIHIDFSQTADVKRYGLFLW